jgi:hypothetical protein
MSRIRRRRRLDKRFSLGLLATATAVVGALGFTGCTSDDAGGACVSDPQYFAEQAWAPVLSQKCIGCHNPQGAAKDSGMVLSGSSEAGFLDKNYEIVKNAASLQQDGVSQLLVMPTGGTAARKHPGGVVVLKGSEEYKALEELVNRFNEPSACETNVSGNFAGALLATPVETLRKASLALSGRLPTAAEEAAVQSGGDKALDPILDKLMTEEAFFQRLRQIYNDVLLTDLYLGNEDAVQLLGDENPYYNPYWYEGVNDPQSVQKYGATDANDLYYKLRDWTNRGVAREPLELIVHVVKNNKSFQEILTADYIMVNPFSAQAFGATDATFKNDADPSEFAPGHVALDGYNFPHAGILSSPMFLNRYPTTSTNRNRARSRVTYLFFLGTDILKTAEQPIDSSKIVDFNPTMNKSECAVCHAKVDPLAGAFHNFDEMARYNPDDKWLEDMRPPGFGGENVPTGDFPKSLQWVAPRVANDPGFALSAVFTIFTGLTGQKPLIAPPDPTAADFQLTFRAYLAQYHTFNKIAKDFQTSGYNLKTVVKGIVHSHYFRAKNAGAPLTPEQKIELGELGMGQLLIPEQLNKKITAVLGYPWRGNPYDEDVLLNRNIYRLLYGGIDSGDVTKRVVEPNGIMANIIDRMSNEMACISVPRDFQKPQAERILFKHVEPTFEPKDSNGFEIAPSVEAIKKQIQFLHKHVLDERLELGDAELQRTYDLFVQTWQEGKDGMASSDEMIKAQFPENIPGVCQVHEEYWTQTELPEGEHVDRDEKYTIRAWMAVMTYLLSDYAFVYE